MNQIPNGPIPGRFHWLRSRLVDTRPSLLIFIANCTNIAFTGFILHNNYLADDAPLLLRILFYPFAILTFFACFPAFAGVMIGFSELRAKPTNVMSVVGTLGNLVLLVGYFILVGLMWPALMGV